MSLPEAAEAAAHWGGSTTPPLPLRERENAVYRVDLPGGRAALRLHRRGYQSRAAIESELWWCMALADAGLPVPRPVAGRNGAMVCTLASGRLASAIGWLEGEAIGAAGTPLAGDLATQCRLMQDLGGLVARMHSATDALLVPPAFTRPRWDIDGLLGEAPLWGRFWDHPALSVPEAAAFGQIRAWLRGVLPDAGDFGLIHADVLRENVMQTPTGLALIDFDDAGFGHRLYDLGTALSQALGAPDYAALSDAMLAGYAAIRPVPANAGAQVQAFTLMRACASVGWLAGRVAPDQAPTRAYIDRALIHARALGVL